MDNKEESLETRIVQLPTPTYPNNQSKFYQEALQNQAPLVVEFLKTLKENFIDRRNQPVIATTTSKLITNDFHTEKEFNRQLARAISYLAGQNNLHIEISTDGVTYKSDGQVEGQLEKYDVTQTLQDLTHMIGNEKPEEKAVVPDFRLQITIEFDLTYHGNEFQRLTSNYHDLVHKISLVYKTSEPTP